MHRQINLILMIFVCEKVCWVQNYSCSDWKVSSATKWLTELLALCKQAELKKYLIIAIRAIRFAAAAAWVETVEAKKFLLVKLNKKIMTKRMQGKSGKL